MKNEFLYNFIGKVLNSISTLMVMPLIGYYFDEFYLGLYGILVTITVVMLVMEGGLSASMISFLSRFRQRDKSQLVSSYLFEYFVFFVILGCFAFLLIAAFGSYSQYFISDLISYQHKNILFFYYGLFCFSSFLILYFQSVSYGLGYFKKYNFIFIGLSSSKLVIPAMLLYFSVVTDFIDLILVLLIINLLFVIIYFIYIIDFHRLSVVRLNLFKMRRVKRGLVLGLPVLFVSLSSVFYTQFDKILGLKFLSLESFGVYSFASSIASLPLILSSVVYSVLFPKFSMLKSKDQASLLSLFNKSSIVFFSLLSLIYAFSLTIVSFLLRYFEPDFLIVSGDSSYFYYCFALLLMGSIVQAFSIIPYCFQIVNNSVSIVVRINYYLLPVFAVGFYFLFIYFGSLTLPFFWLLYNFSFISLLYLFALRPQLKSLHLQVTYN